MTVSVSGDVEAALVDSRGRRTGWYDGRVEDIPGCALEALEDDVAEPHDYTFKFSDGAGDTYRLLMKPRTNGEVEASITVLLSNGRRCVAQIGDELLIGERQWRLRWSTARDECIVTITPIRLKKGRVGSPH
ncbi:MAG TPA: hypothetical protein VGK93_08990 [Candidatus Eisenbacteria bacterium]